MRNETDTERLRIASLQELDALVGKYVTKETPQVFWEEQHACMRFDTVEEALEAMHDPYFQHFIPEDEKTQTALTEIQEFRAYSTELSLAWELVERVSPKLDALHVRREGNEWCVAFGAQPPCTAKSAPVAICLAALRASGIDVDLLPEANVASNYMS